MDYHDAIGRRGFFLRSTIAGVIAAGTILAAALASPSPARADDLDGSQWQALAQCESGGNPAINTGNGYYGLYQFDHGTWLANGGGIYGDNAHEATAEQQTEIAKKLYAARGVSPWPACARKLGLADDVSGRKPAAEPVEQPASAPDASPVTGDTERAIAEDTPARYSSAVRGSYQVRAGDTLSSIATAHAIQGGWRLLFGKNCAAIADPNLIFPGQRIAL